MSSKLSVKELSFISYFLFSHNSCDCCAIPDDDADEDKVGFNVEDGEEKKEDDNEDLEVSDKDIDRSNDDEEKYSPNKTKEEMPKNLSFFKGVLDSDNLLPLNFNRETLHKSKIIKVKAIEMLRKIAEKDESKKEKDNGIDNDTKEVDINDIAETDNDKILFDAANDAPPQDAMTTNTAATAEEGGEDDDVGAKDGNDNNGAALCQ